MNVIYKGYRYSIAEEIDGNNIRLDDAKGTIVNYGEPTLIVDPNDEQWNKAQYPNEDSPNEYRLLEAVADIAFLAGAKGYSSGDSREDINNIIGWAKEFETTLEVDPQGNESFNGEEYLGAIENFAMGKLGKVPSRVSAGFQFTEKEKQYAQVVDQLSPILAASSVYMSPMLFENLTRKLTELLS